MQALELCPVFATGWSQASLAAGILKRCFMHGVPAQAFHQAMRRQPTLGLLAQVAGQRPAAVQQVTPGLDGRGVWGGRSGVFLVAGAVLRDQRVDPAGLRQSRRQRGIQRTEGRTLILRPGRQPVLQPGQRRHRTLGLVLDHFGVARQGVEHLAARQPLQRHLAAVGTRRQHLDGVAFQHCGQQVQAVGQTRFAIPVQACPDVISDHPQILARSGQQRLRQLDDLFDVGPGQLVDLLTHALEIIIAGRIFPGGQVRADRLQPGLPVPCLRPGKAHGIPLPEATFDQSVQAHSNLPFSA
ncbi:hypothetical protein D3C73_644760 [compost metagenome]